MSKISQVTIVGKPQPKDWDDFEHGCLMTFGGGYKTNEEVSIFHHGISTVFNLLRAEFPPAEQCKAAPDLLAALKAISVAFATLPNECSHGAECVKCAAVKKARAAIALAEGA